MEKRLAVRPRVRSDDLEAKEPALSRSPTPEQASRCCRREEAGEGKPPAAPPYGGWFVLAEENFVFCKHEVEV